MIELRPIGHVRSPLVDLADAPRQGDEGAPEACVVVADDYIDGLAGIAAGDELIVLTWLDRASRDVLSVHPRGEPDRTRAGRVRDPLPDRPNPIGVHRVLVTDIDGDTLQVSNLEAIDGTPVVDIKPVLGSIAER